MNEPFDIEINGITTLYSLKGKTFTQSLKKVKIIYEFKKTPKHTG
jgi:hypothetical protein